MRPAPTPAEHDQEPERRLEHAEGMQERPTGPDAEVEVLRDLNAVLHIDELVEAPPDEQCAERKPQKKQAPVFHGHWSANPPGAYSCATAASVADKSFGSREALRRARPTRRAVDSARRRAASRGRGARPRPSRRRAAATSRTDRSQCRRRR